MTKTVKRFFFSRFTGIGFDSSSLDQGCKNAVVEHQKDFSQNKHNLSDSCTVLFGLNFAPFLLKNEATLVPKKALLSGILPEVVIK